MATQVNKSAIVPQNVLDKVTKGRVQVGSKLQTSAPLNVNAPKEMPVRLSTGLDPAKYNAGGGVINPYGAPITSSAMSPTTPVKLPEPTIPTAPATAQSAIEASTAGVKATPTPTAPQPIQQDNLTKVMQDVLGVQSEMATAQSGVDRSAQDTARQEADRLTSEIEAKANATRRQVEELRKNNPQGVFGGALEDQIRDIERASLSEQADLSILQNAALRRFDTAKSIADRQLELKLEPLRLKLDNLKFFYQENKDILNKSDDRAYQEKIKQQDREYEKTKAIETQITDLKKNVTQYAGNSAPAILAQLNNIDTSKPDAVSKALAVAGQYQTDPLDRAFKTAQISNIYSEIGKRNQEAAKLKREGQPVSFVTPPIINPSTGKVDPVSQLSTLIKSTEGKTSDNLKNVLGVVSAAQSLASSSSDGKFEGIGPIALSGPLTTKKGQLNKTNIEAVNLKIQQWASGASLTPEQTKKVQNIAAQVTDNDKQVRNKTNAIVNFMLSQVRSDLASQGINYEPAEIDLFSDITTTSNEQFLQLLPTSETPQSTNLDFFSQYN